LEDIGIVAAFDASKGFVMDHSGYSGRRSITLEAQSTQDPNNIEGTYAKRMCSAGGYSDCLGVPLQYRVELCREAWAGSGSAAAAGEGSRC
jgi:hypothetical protein